MIQSVFYDTFYTLRLDSSLVAASFSFESLFVEKMMLVQGDETTIVYISAKKKCSSSFLSTVSLEASAGNHVVI